MSRKRQRLLSIIFLWSGVVVIFGFLAFADKTQIQKLDLVMGLGTFLIMLSFVLHRGEMRGRSFTLTGKPAEFARKVGIVTLGFISIYSLLHYFGII